MTDIDTGPSGTASMQNLEYTWTDTGNLSSRKDWRPSALNEESFTYDNLHRLTEAKLNGTPTVTLQYDAAGRITSKSDTGTFAYDSGTHRVNNVTGTRAASYAYDTNGNMTCRLGSAGTACTGGDAIT